jgi:single-strand DNA-binding protein
MTMAAELEVLHRNEVVVAGRLSTTATAKDLPSGDEVVTWRLIVDRPPGAPGKCDVLECAAFNGRVRRQALSWNAGDVVEVSGALRRRFWRGPAGLQSKYEVHVDSATRLTPPKRPRKPG